MPRLQTYRAWLPRLVAGRFAKMHACNKCFAAAHREPAPASSRFPSIATFASHLPGTMGLPAQVGEDTGDEAGGTLLARPVRTASPFAAMLKAVVACTLFLAVGPALILVNKIIMRVGYSVCVPPPAAPLFPPGP